MEAGSKVRLRPTKMTSLQLSKLVMAYGEVTGEIAGVSGIGVCTVVLPLGVTLPGHSHPFTFNGVEHHYIDLHKQHLESV
jgi:hypothetical protein